MSEFTNVTVVKKANIYFDGKVASHTVLFPDGSKKTLGIMQAGDYEFSTGAAEINSGAICPLICTLPLIITLPAQSSFA